MSIGYTGCKIKTRLDTIKCRTRSKPGLIICSKSLSHLAPCWAAGEVLVALFLANSHYFPLEADRTRERTPPEGDGGVWKLLQILRFAAMSSVGTERKAGYVSGSDNRGQDSTGSLFVSKFCPAKWASNEADRYTIVWNTRLIKLCLLWTCKQRTTTTTSLELGSRQSLHKTGVVKPAA